VKLGVDIKLTPAQLAEAFCELDDEAQAQFFIECARIGETWETRATCFQWHAVGRHLRDCECSTYEAREMVRDIAACLEDGA
jgi:hypothetical protein